MPRLPCPWGDYQTPSSDPVQAAPELALHVWNSHRNEPKPPKLPSIPGQKDAPAPTS